MNKKTTRKCSDCKKILPLNKDYFYIAPPEFRRLGFYYRCKECTSNRAKEKYKKEREYHLLYSKKYYKNKKNRKKILATVKVRLEVRKGKLLKEPCEICGKLNVHAHHDNYKKPLKVRWLCPSHHKIFHLGL